MKTQRQRRRMMRAGSFVLLALAMQCVTWQATLLAAESASGALLYEQVDATNFRYNINLKNTGTTPIGTLWYSWIPGEDFMGSRPTNVSAPAGWSATVTNSGASDGFAIEFINSSGPLMPGEIVSGFRFDSSQTPAQLAGNSPFFPGSHVGTTFIYSGGPFSDAGVEFEINPTNLPWQNPFSRFDVDDNGLISAHDAVLIINALIKGGVRPLATPTTTNPSPPFVDARGDNLLSAADALAVINHLITAGTSAAQAAALEQPQASAVLRQDTSIAPLAEFGGLTSHSVPEPAGFALCAAGLLALAGLLPMIRRRARANELRR